MRHLTLALIAKLGRFTSIPLFLLAIIPAIYWLDLLDQSPVLFLLASLLVIPIAIAGCALLVGSIIAGSRRPNSIFFDRKTLPDLWALWDRTGGSEITGRRLLAIDDDMNASISERRTILGLFGRESVLTLGLPLLMLLDEEKLTAVIAHEVGHVECRHTNGLTNICEFETSTATLFEVAPPDQTIVGNVLEALIGWLATSLEPEHRRMAWRSEFEADAASVRRSGVENTAQLLAVITAARHHHEKFSEEALHSDVLKLARVPNSPMSRYIEDIAHLRTTEALQKHFDLALTAPQEDSDTHPSNLARLNAINAKFPLLIGKLGPSAADRYLPLAEITRLVQIFEAKWVDLMSRYLKLE